MVKLPKDPVILLSYVNTQLRDYYPSFEECCLSLGADGAAVMASLASIGYYYDETRNQFI